MVKKKSLYQHLFKFILHIYVRSEDFLTRLVILDIIVSPKKTKLDKRSSSVVERDVILLLDQGREGGREN